MPPMGRQRISMSRKSPIRRRKEGIYEESSGQVYSVYANVGRPILPAKNAAQTFLPVLPKSPPPLKVTLRRP